MTVRAILAMRWHLLWYAPFFLFNFMRVVVENAIVGAFNLKEVFIDNFTFGLFLSSSAMTFISATIASVLLPLLLLTLIPTFFNRDSEFYGRRFLWAFLFGFVGVTLVIIVTEFTLWGSYPFGYDSDGAQRLRMFPFVPWPDTPFELRDK